MSIRRQSTCVNRSVVAFLAIAALFIGSTTASAQFPNKKTTVTFNEPVEIPGVDAQVLPAGVYVFERRALEHVASTGFQDIKENLIPRLHRAGERAGAP